MIGRGGMCAPTTECSNKIPQYLMNILNIKFPKFHVPDLKNLDQKSVNFDVSDGGDGCFAVTVGKFGGNGHHKDYAILLISEIGGVPKLIVALSRSNTWIIYQLQAFCDTITFCYVKTRQSGVYNRTQSLDFGPVGNNELEHLVSKNQVVLTGTLESTEIIYAYIGKEWFHVWIGD
jgi:hypothetical protein